MSRTEKYVLVADIEFLSNIRTCFQRRQEPNSVIPWSLELIEGSGLVMIPQRSRILREWTVLDPSWLREISPHTQRRDP